MKIILWAGTVLAIFMHYSVNAISRHTIINMALESSDTTIRKTENMENVKIKITSGDKTMIATLNDSETTKDFIALLPLTLTLKDYAQTEKISDLPKRLTVNDASTGSKLTIGDIAYYAPWGNLAIFYKEFNHSPGLVFLGKIESNIEILTEADDIEVTIALID